MRKIILTLLRLLLVHLSLRAQAVTVLNRYRDYLLQPDADTRTGTLAITLVLRIKSPSRFSPG